MKLTDHGDLDPAVEKRLEIDDAVRAKYRADELARQTTLVLDALREQRPSMASQVADYFCNADQDRLVCLIAKAYWKAYWIGDWQPVIDELRELFDAAVESVAEENLPTELKETSE
jgi:N-acetylglucosamine kinase-like BadF-type ATPase